MSDIKVGGIWKRRLVRSTISSMVQIEIVGKWVTYKALDGPFAGQSFCLPPNHLLTDFDEVDPFTPPPVKPGQTWYNRTCLALVGPTDSDVTVLSVLAGVVTIKESEDSFAAFAQDRFLELYTNDPDEYAPKVGQIWQNKAYKVNRTLVEILHLDDGTPIYVLETPSSHKDQNTRFAVVGGTQFTNTYRIAP